MGFQSFVILAGMRTGSNLLESHLNAVQGIECHGEAFNPQFVGYPKRDEILGVTLAARQAEPLSLLARIRAQDGVLGGFRFFRDHDPRALQAVLDDPACAKIILTRNPVDSFISLQIARQTGQWKLTDAQHRRQARIRFDSAAFETYLEEERTFLADLRRALQQRGQAAFSLTYDDLGDPEILSGLVRYLDPDLKPAQTQARLKRQNPEPASDKVTNPKEMERALARIDWAGLEVLPVSEPARGPAVRRYVAGAKAPLLYIPLPGAPEHAVTAWLAALDGVPEGDLQRGFNQRTLRQWKRRNPGHRSFAVVHHPLARAHHVFWTRILPKADDRYADIRAALRDRYDVPLPATDPGDGYATAQHRAAFLGFLQFLKANLAGQTSLRVDAGWASQGVLLQGVGAFSLPDMVVRAENLTQELAFLAGQVGLTAPVGPPAEDATPIALADIYDPEIEAAARAAYQRDYMLFGYQAWAD